MNMKSRYVSKLQNDVKLNDFIATDKRYFIEPTQSSTCLLSAYF